MVIVIPGRVVDGTVVDIAIGKKTEQNQHYFCCWFSLLRRGSCCDSQKIEEKTSNKTKQAHAGWWEGVYKVDWRPHSTRPHFFIPSPQSPHERVESILCGVESYRFIIYVIPSNKTTARLIVNTQCPTGNYKNIAYSVVYTQNDLVLKFENFVRIPQTLSHYWQMNMSSWSQETLHLTCLTKSKPNQHFQFLYIVVSTNIRHYYHWQKYRRVQVIDLR